MEVTMLHTQEASNWRSDENG